VDLMGVSRLRMVLNRILCAGQCAAWMSRAQVRKTKVAFGFGTVIERFCDREENRYVC
jgi:hypothetical protein